MNSTSTHWAQIGAELQGCFLACQFSGVLSKENQITSYSKSPKFKTKTNGLFCILSLQKVILENHWISRDLSHHAQLPPSEKLLTYSSQNEECPVSPASQSQALARVTSCHSAAELSRVPEWTSAFLEFFSADTVHAHFSLILESRSSWSFPSYRLASTSLATGGGSAPKLKM